MTVQELYDQVSQLGFETSLEDNERFFQAANRALLQVNRIRPATAYVQLAHMPIANGICENTLKPILKGSEDIVYECEGAKAFYFESDISAQSGNVVIEYYEDGEWNIALNLASKLPSTNGVRAYKKYKGFIYKNGTDDTFFENDTRIRIRFTGDFSYSVKNTALYKTVYSPQENGIPEYGEYVAYNITDFASDFSRLCCPPIRDDAEQLFVSKDYTIDGDDTLLLPRSKKGEYKVWYERKPREILAFEERVDLPNDLCALMPYLIARDIWLDDEPTKADYYFSIYREQEQKLTYEAKHLSPLKIINKNGW